MKARPTNTEIWADWLGLKTCGDPQLEKLVGKCANWTRAFRDRKPACWLSLLGKSGTGKTHCAEVLWRKLRDKVDITKTAYIPHIIYWPKYVERLRQNIAEGYGTGMLLDMIDWPLLILDDVGAERDTTGFAAEKLNTILGSRVRKWTVITSNLTLKGISAIDVRIADRMIREPGNQWIELDCQRYSMRP